MVRRKAIFRNFSTRFNLIIGFTLLISIFLFYGVYSIVDLRIISNLTETIYHHPLAVSNAALAASNSVTRIHRNMKDVVLHRSNEQLKATIISVDVQEEIVYQHLDIVKNKILGEEGRQLEKSARKLFRDWRPIRQEVIDLVNSGRYIEARDITMGKGARHVLELEEAMLGLVDYARDKAAHYMAQSKQTYFRLSVILISFLVLGILLSFFIAAFIYRQILSTEKTISESEAKYRAMMESIIDPFYICSPDKKIRYMNSAMKKRIGGDATGEICYTALHGLKEPCKWCQFDHLKENMGTKSTITSPLDNRTFQVVDTPVKIDNGISKMSIYRDMTDYLKAVEEKEQAQAQLFHSQKIESIGTLAGGIAHDFNNILYPIIGFTELSLKELGHDHPIRENLEDILQGAKRAKDLVQQILLFSHQDKSQKEPLNIKPLIMESFKLLRATIPKNIDIRQNYCDDPIRVTSNPSEIHQIVMNLATNAYHAMEKSGGVLSIALKKEIPPENLGLQPIEHCLIEIRDTGHGISSTHVEKIFEPYFTTKELGKGSGLGLSVVHGIVKNSHGEISVKSEINAGTIVYVYLPITEKNEPGNNLSPDKKHMTGTERILFVDDEPAIAKLGKRLLEPLGYIVTALADSQAALTHFAEDPDAFDLIITDMTMPGLMGIQMIEQMHNVRPDIPVILCSGYVDKIQPSLLKESGISACINKPITQKELSVRIRKIFDG